MTLLTLLRPRIAITGVGIFPLTPTSVLVNWTTDIPATSEVLYGTTPAYGSTSQVNPLLTTSHSVRLDYLTPAPLGTQYHYQIRSTTMDFVALTSDNVFITLPQTPTPSLQPLVTPGSGSAIEIPPVTITSARGQRMQTYVPGAVYNNSNLFKALMQVFGQEFDDARAAMDQVRDQFFVDTATWSLATWERQVGLVPQPGQTYDQRRSKVKSLLRGYGTATKLVVQNVASAYLGGAVDVIEDFLSYTIVIRFVGVGGIPSNLTDLQNAVRAVTPAHLAIVYQYRFTIWDRWDTLNWTWDMTDAASLSFDQADVYV